MAAHQVRMVVHRDERAHVLCSCGSELGDFRGVLLDDVNRLAHEHIEAADRAPFIR